MHTTGREHGQSEATQGSYGSAFKSWETFCGLQKVNYLCLDKMGKVLDLDVMEEWISSYVAMQCGIRNMKPESIRKVYLP